MYFFLIHINSSEESLLAFVLLNRRKKTTHCRTGNLNRTVQAKPSPSTMAKVQNSGGVPTLSQTIDWEVTMCAYQSHYQLRAGY